MYNNASDVPLKKRKKSLMKDVKRAYKRTARGTRRSARDIVQLAMKLHEKRK